MRPRPEHEFQEAILNHIICSQLSGPIMTGHLSLARPPAPTRNLKYAKCSVEAAKPVIGVEGVNSHRLCMHVSWGEVTSCVAVNCKPLSEAAVRGKGKKLV